LARQDSSNPVYRDWLATTCYWHSSVAGKLSRNERWVMLVFQAGTLWQGLAEEQPGNMALQQKVADIRWGLLWLRGLGSSWKGNLPSLEEARTRLDRQVAADPARTALRKRLALTCLVLGEFYLWKRSTWQALPCWRQAYEHSRKLAREEPDDPLV